MCWMIIPRRPWVRGLLKLKRILWSLLSVPPKATEYNGKQCPACFAWSEKCKAELMNCTGWDTSCFEMITASIASKCFHVPWHGLLLLSHSIGGVKIKSDCFRPRLCCRGMGGQEILFSSGRGDPSLRPDGPRRLSEASGIRRASLGSA